MCRKAVSLPGNQRVYSVAFSPDGKTLACGADDQHGVTLWEVAAWKKVPRGPDVPTRWKKRAVLPCKDGYGSAVFAVAFDPSGKYLAAGGWGGVATNNEGVVRLWEVRSGKEVVRISYPSPAMAVAFSRDGATPAVASGVSLHLWDAVTGEPRGRALPHGFVVQVVAFSPDGSHLGTGNEDGGVRLWDPVTCRPLGLPVQHQGAVYALAFSSDSRLVLSGSFDTTVRVWHVRTRSPVGRPFHHPGPVHRVAFSPREALLAIGSTENTARVWDLGPDASPVPPPFRPGIRRALAFSADGTRLLTGGDDGSAQFWAVVTRKAVGEPCRHGEHVRAVAFSPPCRRAGRLLDPAPRVGKATYARASPAAVSRP